MGLRNAEKPAFPNKLYDNRAMNGMTKREYFAGLAMQAILASEKYAPPRRLKFSGMAEDAVAAADALIEQLNR